MAAEPKWVQVQKKGFTKWANVYLGMRRMHIEDLYTDLATGVALINLLEVIGQEKIGKKYTKNPKMRIQRLENIGIAFRYLTKKGITLTNTSPNDVVDGNGKIILGLMWTIISQFQVSDIKLDGVSGKDGLMLWFKRQVAGYEGVKVKDFSGSFKSGLAFLALLHKYRPAVIPYDELREAGDARRNLEIAFTAGRDFFGVEPLLDPEDICDVKRPDEKIIICYVSFLFSAIASMAHKDSMAKSIHKALDLTRQHDAWIEQYLAAVAASKAWIGTAEAKYAGEVEGNTLEGVKATLDSLYEFRREDKTVERAKLTSQGNLLNTLHSSQKNNNRPLYEPPAGSTVADMLASWKGMEEQEDGFEVRVRTTYGQFEMLENTLARFEATVAKTNVWIEKQNATFDSSEYGHSVTEVETLMEAFKAYEQQAAHFKTVVDTMDGWVNTDEMAVHADHTAAMAKLDAVKAGMDDMASRGAAYSAELDAALTRHQELVGQIKLYNSKCTEFVFSVDGIVEDMLHQPIPTVSEAAVNALLAEFTEESPARLEAMQSSFEEIIGVADNLRANDVDAFKRFPVSMIELRLQSVKDASAARERQLLEAQAAEQEKEALRVSFAELAAQFKGYCESKQAECAGVSGSLEEQAAAVAALREEYGAQDERLEAIKAAAASLDAKGVVNNPHTRETIHSLLAVWAELGKYLSTSQENIQGMLIAERSGDVTPEQIKEIKEVFDYFDVDGDDNLNMKEFHSCTTGIGIVFTEEQMMEAFASIDVSGDGLIDFDEFTTFMAERLKEPGAASADVQRAFNDLSDLEGTITDSQVKRFFMLYPDDIAYLEDCMPVVSTETAEDGTVERTRNTEAFVEELFRR